MSRSFSGRRRGLAAAGLLLALFAAGCGERTQPLFPVRGQVLDAEGKPAAGAKVIFHPVGDAAAGGARPVGVADDSGTFTLTTFKAGDGAPPGNYAVTVEWRAAPNSPFSRASADRLQGRFANAATSTLKVTVAPQQNTLEPFHLN